MTICRIQQAILHCKTFESLLAHTLPFDNDFTNRLLGKLQVEERPTHAQLRLLPNHLRKLVKHVPVPVATAQEVDEVPFGVYPGLFSGPEYDLTCSAPDCDFIHTHNELWSLCPKCGGKIVVEDTRCITPDELERYIETLPAHYAAEVRAMPEYAVFIAGRPNVAA